METITENIFKKNPRVLVIGDLDVVNNKYGIIW